MGLLMAVESWILAIVGWAWLAIRGAVLGRSLLEETCVYGTLLVSTVNLLLCGSAPGARGDFFRAHGVAVLALGCLLAYGAADSLPQPGTGRGFAPDGPVAGCCPNLRLAESNRALYFGGASLYLVPAAVTLALQAFQILLAAGALVGEGGSAFPGHQAGVLALALFAALCYLRLSGSPVPPPCPDANFRMLFNISLFNYGHVLALLGVCLLLLLGLDGFGLGRALSLVLRTGQLALAALFCASAAYALHARGMLTWSAVALLAKGLAGAVLGFFAVCRPEDAPELSAECLRPRRRTRLVMPISTKKTA